MDLYWKGVKRNTSEYKLELYLYTWNNNKPVKNIRYGKCMQFLLEKQGNIQSSFKFRAERSVQF